MHFDSSTQINMLQNFLIGKIWKFLSRTFMMELIINKSQAYTVYRLQLYCKVTLSQIFFWNVKWKLAVLEQIFKERSLLWTSMLKVCAPCSIHFTNFSKTGTHIISFCRGAENCNLFTRKTPLWKFLFSKVAGLGFKL